MQSGRLRRGFFLRLFTILAGLLGVFQVVIGHWVVVVFAGHPGPGLAVGLVLAAALVAANLIALPSIRRAARSQGWVRRVARGYLALGLATLFLGLVIVLAWVGFLPLAGLLALLGIGPEVAFNLFRIVSAAVVLALAGMILWGFTIGARRVERTHVRIPVRDLDDDLRGLRIAHLTDLHIGNGMEGHRLEQLVERVNALEADMIVLTGDIFDFDPRHVEEGARRLAGLRAARGVYAVLGNHDVYTGIEVVTQALAEHAPNLRLLRGEYERVPHEAPFYVAGVDDPGRGWTDAETELLELELLAERKPDDGPVLLLVHRPQLFPQASRLGFPVVLAGHTHGGQLALPSRGGHINLARFITRFHRGMYRLNGSILYVNRGIGVAGPAIRFNCDREIATIELV